MNNCLYDRCIKHDEPSRSSPSLSCFDSIILLGFLALSETSYHGF